MVSHKLVVKDDPMRTHHWLTAFLSGMMVLTVGWTASAQTPPVEATGQAAYSSVNYDAPAEAGYLPEPAISPFEHVFDETYEENGMWLRDYTNATRNRYSFTAEALFSHTRAPGNAKAGNSKVSAATFFYNGTRAIDNGDTGPTSLDPTFYPPMTPNGRSAFMQRGTGLVGAPGGNGVQLKFRIDRPDGEFLELSGFGIFNNEAHHSYGRPIVRVGQRGVPAAQIDYILGGFEQIVPGQTLISPPIQMAYVAGTNGANSRFTDPLFGKPGGPNNIPTDLVNLNRINYNMPGVGVNDGTTDGTIIRADSYYYQFMTSAIYGTGFTWGQSPQHRFGAFTVQPTFGVRYLNVSEHYGLRLQDSGVDYSFVTDTTDPRYGFIDTAYAAGYPPIRQRLDSYTATNLAGPEIGLSYKAGANVFSFLGATKFGLLGAHERATVTAKGLGQPWVINGVGDFLSNPYYNSNKFTSRTINHSFITPSFQQSITTRSHLLGYVPLVRNIRAFREAEFTAGYTIMMLFQLSRPNQTIVWNANTGVNPNAFDSVITPKQARNLAPEPMVNRTVWWMSNFNVGVNWQF